MQTKEKQNQETKRKWKKKTNAMFIGSHSFQSETTLEKLPPRFSTSLWVSQVILGVNTQRKKLAQDHSADSKEGRSLEA